jgi:hypothetical protein
MAIFPFDGDGIGAYCFDIAQMCGRRILGWPCEPGWIWIAAHVFMPAAALCAWTGIAEQRKWIETVVAIAPGHSQMTGLAIGGNTGGSDYTHPTPL